MIGRDLASPADGHGEDLAAFLVTVHYSGRVVCHSTNSFGAALIEKALKDGGITVEVALFDVLGVFREK